MHILQKKMQFLNFYENLRILGMCACFMGVRMFQGRARVLCMHVFLGATCVILSCLCLLVDRSNLYLQSCNHIPINQQVMTQMSLPPLPIS